MVCGETRVAKTILEDRQALWLQADRSVHAHQGHAKSLGPVQSSSKGIVIVEGRPLLGFWAGW